MMYDLRNDLQREQFLLRASRIAEKAASVVELTEKKQRSLSQNSYLHLAISYFALQYGESASYCKEVFYKRTCNSEFFLRSRYDKVLNTDVQFTRSSADLTALEMSLTIDRFLHWSATTAGIYIPPPDRYDMVQQMQVEVERNAHFINQE